MSLAALKLHNCIVESFNSISQDIEFFKNNNKKNERKGKEGEKRCLFASYGKCLYFDVEEPVSSLLGITRNYTLQIKNDIHSDGCSVCSLEDLKVGNNDMKIVSLTGTIIVKNSNFYKHIIVRYTTDYWSTLHDTEGFYINSISDDFDRFMFKIRIDPVNQETACAVIHIEMAIQYEIGTEIGWDNNNNINYSYDLTWKDENPFERITSVKF